jgi:hypothetical protein
MLIKIKPSNSTIQEVVEEVIKSKSNEEGLGIDQWMRVLEVCTYLNIPCESLLTEVNNVVKATKPNFKGIILLEFKEREECLSTLDKYLGTSHLEELHNLINRTRERLSRADNNRN